MGVYRVPVPRSPSCLSALVSAQMGLYNNPAPEDYVLVRREVQNVLFKLEKR